MLTIILAVLVLVLAFEYASVLNATRGAAELPDRRIWLGRILILGNPNRISKREANRQREWRARMDHLRRPTV